MSNDPAYDYDAWDAQQRRQRYKWAQSHTCEHCDHWESPPEGSWGWCRYFEDFERIDYPARRCEYWND